MVSGLDVYLVELIVGGELITLLSSNSMMLTFSPSNTVRNPRKPTRLFS